MSAMTSTSESEVASRILGCGQPGEGRARQGRRQHVGVVGVGAVDDLEDRGVVETHDVAPVTTSDFTPYASWKARTSE